MFIAARCRGVRWTLCVIALGLWTVRPAEAQPLTLEAAWSGFLERSPLVAAEKEKLEMARGRLTQAGTWANPVLSYSQEGYALGAAESGYDDQEFLITAWQEFELGGKRRKRAELARLRVEAEKARYRDFLRRKRLEISGLFVRAFYASKLRDALDLAFREYEGIREVHRKRYEQGEASGLAQLKIDAEEAWYLVRLAGAERELNASWSELAAMIGQLGGGPPEFEPPPSAESELPDIDALIEKALESRPDLEGQRLDAMAAEQEVVVEKANRTPDLNLGGGYKRDFSRNSFFFGVQLPLPLWDRRQGAIEEKLAGSRRQTTLAAWSEVWIRQEVERAYASYSRLLAAARRFDSAVAGKLERTVAIAALSYQEGEAGILDYLDALRTQREVLLEHNQLLAETHYARLELEAAVGARIHEISP